MGREAATAPSRVFHEPLHGRPGVNSARHRPPHGRAPAGPHTPRNKPQARGDFFLTRFKTNPPDARIQGGNIMKSITRRNLGRSTVSWPFIAPGIATLLTVLSSAGMDAAAALRALAEPIHSVAQFLPFKVLATAGAFAFFTRIEPDDLAGHPVRQKIMQRLEGGKALRLQELTKETGHPDWRLRHHLRLLERTRTVVAHGRSWKRRYKLRSTPAVHVRPTDLPVGDYVVSCLPSEPIRFIDLARQVQRRVPVSKMGIWKAIQKLATEGKLRQHKQGRRVWVSSLGVAPSGACRWSE